MTLIITKNISHFFKRFCTSTWYVNTCQNHSLSENSNNDGLILPQSYKKCVKVAFLGLPNVGKSTLVNKLTRRSICPASTKVHTTLHKAEATYIENDTQIVFIDTPGVVSKSEIKKYKLPETFQEDPSVSVKQADVIGVIQDVTNVYTRHKINNFVRNYLQNKREDASLLLILNKVDRIKKKEVLLELTRLLTNDECNPKFDDIFMISAFNGDGVDDLRNYLIDSAKATEWKYEEDHYTDQKFETIIQETIRAKLLDSLPFHMPYTIKLQINELNYTDDDGIMTNILLHCSKYVSRTLLKNKGEIIKSVAFRTEKELRNAFRRSVNIYLSVVEILDKNKNA